MAKAYGFLLLSWIFLSSASVETAASHRLLQGETGRQDAELAAVSPEEIDRQPCATATGGTEGHSDGRHTLTEAPGADKAAPAARLVEGLDQVQLVYASATEEPSPVPSEQAPPQPYEQRVKRAPAVIPSPDEFEREQVAVAAIAAASPSTASPGSVNPPLLDAFGLHDAAHGAHSGGASSVTPQSQASAVVGTEEVHQVADDIVPGSQEDERRINLAAAGAGDPQARLAPLMSRCPMSVSLL